MLQFRRYVAKNFILVARQLRWTLGLCSAVLGHRLRRHYLGARRRRSHLRYRERSYPPAGRPPQFTGYCADARYFHALRQCRYALHYQLLLPSIPG